ncbi:uncharacterized protein C1orf159 homolog isoform X2 [Callorhinchus milii]|uniref:uncharacterized protein C1orf159 homolog isoform X2 n=1 Tax=Callorhinchus milii TaxID=7868 RepID=UPI00045756CE|nr:uncharacterized protein C1orf159 homolog isoform X2 [Callorhinchus milii]|eukprot:gi/632977061/ref/XP_007905138.1/ PREDICTED: uncharacterized protein C1orf159 homolog isoform X2 [Callorhinchus milii]
MAAPFVVMLVMSLFLSDCCIDLLDEFGLCPQSSLCHSDCYRHWFKNGSSTCIKCKNGTLAELSVNQTECINSSVSDEEKAENPSTVVPTVNTIGRSAIVALLCLGTLFISLFLILSVAVFFYTKRSNILPHMFHQRNKASILQPSEMAEMIRSPPSSVRKARYSRRDQLTAASSASTATSNV